ncbi:HD domain-containing protein [Bacillus salitolerans]|uniref:HD domain-containing protein n=1 Tax=Bacillus salitolerans TaxID=1437434 RepID=A0ABW4LMK9_9BACI
MIVSDPLYGDFQLEDVFEELINSKPIQRLKGVHQGGASYLVNEKWKVTRYDHSIGVMLLIRRLGGTIEEQIAGLLHDVSHTAFSHVIDFVYTNMEEDYHEKIFHSVVTNSEIPTILAKYHYNYREILFADERWTLLERSAPELCADRVDYTLRDMYQYGHITLSEVVDFLENLLVYNRKMYLKSVKSAEWFVKVYYQEVIDFFMDPLNIYGYDMLAKILKIPIERGLLSHADLLGQDEEVIQKIKTSKDVEILALLDQLNPTVKVIQDTHHFHIHRKNKIRLIDPTVFQDHEFLRASSLSMEVSKMNKIALEKAKQGMHVRIISPNRQYN